MRAETTPELHDNPDESAARELWNAEADEFNQWDSLGQDEKDEFIASRIGTLRQPRK